VNFRFRVTAPGLEYRLSKLPYAVATGDGYDVTHPDTQLRLSWSEVTADVATIGCVVPCTDAMRWALVDSLVEVGAESPDAVGLAFANANAEALAPVASLVRATVEAPVLEAVYRWNAKRAALQAQVGVDLFVARAFFFAFNGKPVVGAVWVDGVPALLPKADVVVLQREDIANRWLRQAPSAAILPQGDVVNALDLVREGDAWAYRPEKLEERVVRLFIDAPPVAAGLLVALPAMHVFAAPYVC
jgi:hypothetical protein